MLKLVIFASFLTVAYSQNGVPDSRCPPNGTPNPPLHLNDPNNCENFFTCVNGLAMPSRCPEGQHWSRTHGWCDWPDRAQCQGAAPGTCPPGNPSPPVFLPNPNDCSSFYVCNWGTPSPMRCPEGQHWSVGFGWCDWPYRANCTPAQTTRGATRSTTTTRRRS